MTSDDAFFVLDEIPSDSGSITSEAPSEDEIQVDEFIMDPSQEELPENRPVRMTFHYRHLYAR